jgi:hypothetical protein
MKRILPLICLLSLFALLLVQGTSAAEIYIPDQNEIGDLQTDKPLKPETDGDGELNPDSLPHKVDFTKQVLKPTIICAAAASAIYAVLRLIRFWAERRLNK